MPAYDALTPATANNPHDKRRLALVQPTDWENPRPRSRYHLVVIGGGAAGLVTAAGAAGVGANVALVERGALGGDCLNVGCVPSKGLIRAARAVHAAKHGAPFGVRADVEFDFATAMERMRRIRADISHVDSASRFQDELGVDIFLGQAAFQTDGVITVDGNTELRYRKAVIATGARAAAPPIPGLDRVPFHTNESIFALDTLPARLFVIGGGPVGCELAQSFQRFGSQVTLADVAPRLMNNDNEDAAAVIEAALRNDGVELRLGASIARVESVGEGVRVVLADARGVEQGVEADVLLVAAGRSPNVDGLGLERVGVDVDQRGVKIDEHLRTTNKRIFACGDIALPYQFTHAADASARMVIQNALFFGRKRWTDLLIPWATYTEPEVAHVGKTKRMLDDAGVAWDEYKVPFDDVDRGLLEGDTEGFVSVVTARGSDQILGATIVAAHAGESISELALAMQAGKGLGALASVVHPYPTQAEAIRKAGDAYNRTRLTPTVARLLKGLLRLSA